LRAINITRIPLSLDLFLPRITRPHHSVFHNFKKLELFINAGLELVFQKICLKYCCIALAGKQCVNGFVSWRIIVSISFCFGINGRNYERPISDFYFSLLVPISKRGSRTDYNDDEWIMFQLCTDAKRLGSVPFAVRYN